MTDELSDLEWAKVKMRAAVRSARRFTDEEDRIDSYVRALAEPLRRAGRVEELENKLRIEMTSYGIGKFANQRITELEAENKMLKEVDEARRNSIVKQDDDQRYFVRKLQERLEERAKKLLDARKRIEELEAAIGEHRCAPISIAGDGQPIISVGAEEKSLKALLDTETKPSFPEGMDINDIYPEAGL